MSLSSSTNRNEYTGNGSVSIYNYSFRVFAETDLKVIVTDTADPAVETVLTLSTDYTVTGVGAVSGGTIVLVDASQSWLDGSGDLLTNYTITIRRVVSLTQITDLRNQGSYFPETIEDSLDKSVMISQQQQDDLERAVKLREGSTLSDIIMPDPVADKIIGWNPAGDELINLTNSASITTPASSTDNAIVRFSGATGKSIQNSGVTVDDSGNTTGIADLTISGTASGITKTHVGLGNVDNTSDATKNAAVVNLTNKNIISPVITTPSGLVKGDVGLANVDNTSDATKNAASVTLTNKTLTTPVIDVNHLTEQGSTPSTPSSGTKKLYAKTDNKMYSLDSTGLEQELGGGGGAGVKNYFDDVMANLNSSVLTDFSTFDDGSSYVDGTGGIPTILSISATSVVGELLNDDKTLKIIKSNSDATGEGVSLSTRTIDPADYGREQIVNMEIDFSDSNYTSGDFVIMAYDITNSAIIPVIGLDDGIPNVKGKIQFKVLPVSTTAQYRLSIYCETDSNTGVSSALLADNFQSGTDKSIPGYISTPWEAFTPTGSWTANTSYSGFKRRQGQNMEIKVVVSLTGAPTTASLYINNPDGELIDLNNDNGDVTFGTVSYLDASTGVGTMWHVRNNGDNTKLYIGKDNSLMTGIVPIIFANSDRIFINYTIPIVGWADSNTISTTENLFRSSPARIYLSANQSISSSGETKVTFNTVDFDKSSLYSSSDNGFKVASSGVYKTTFAANTSLYTANDNFKVIVKVNNVEVRRHTVRMDTDPSNIITTMLNLNKDDVVTYFVDSTSDTSYIVIGGNIYSEAIIEFVKDTSVFGVNGQVDNKEVILAADYYQASPTANTWYVPNTAFKLDLSPGKYKLRLKGVSFPATTSAVVGNMINVDFQLGTSTTGGSGLIGEKATFHHGAYASNNLYPKEFDYTFDEEFITSVSVTIYVHVRRRVFSGSPTITNVGLRSESGSGNGMDPVLIAERIS